MPTKYGVVFWFKNHSTFKEQWVFDDYKQASDFARSNAGPSGEVYVVRIVPVAVFSAKVVMEPVEQPPADVVNFVE